jgi:hypothetical protein
MPARLHINHGWPWSLSHGEEGGIEALEERVGVFATWVAMAGIGVAGIAGIAGEYDIAPIISAHGGDGLDLYPVNHKSTKET